MKLASDHNRCPMPNLQMDVGISTRFCGSTSKNRLWLITSKRMTWFYCQLIALSLLSMLHMISLHQRTIFRKRLLLLPTFLVVFAIIREVCKKQFVTIVDTLFVGFAIKELNTKAAHIAVKSARDMLSPTSSQGSNVTLFLAKRILLSGFHSFLQSKQLWNQTTAASKKSNHPKAQKIPKKTKMSSWATSKTQTQAYNDAMIPCIRWQNDYNSLFCSPSQNKDFKPL